MFNTKLEKRIDELEKRINKQECDKVFSLEEPNRDKLNEINEKFDLLLEHLGLEIKKEPTIKNKLTSYFGSSCYTEEHFIKYVYKITQKKHGKNSV